MQFLGGFYLLLAATRHTPTARAALHYPNALISRMEHLLVDTDGSFRSGFKDAINPCTNYISGAQTLGRQTSAQWLRVAFHDFVTAHVDEGTGGIDASIGFETLRAEDSGSAFNDSFAFFAPFVDAQTSMADLVALSVVTSLGHCGGLHVPYRAGRIDATGGGPFGVPEPETSLEETLEEFANAGFNAEDAIGLTACGHSLGRVHHGGFPNVVPDSAIAPNNTAGGVNLDSTRDKFDISIVKEYLGNYGQRGGPLVTSDNVTVRSDLRLYESDQNRTMQALGQSKEYFFSTCGDLFERMINTVPREVALSDVIHPMTVKPVNFTFDIINDQTLRLSGVVRYLPSDNAAPSTLEVSLADKAGKAMASITARVIEEKGSSFWGATAYYPVVFDINLAGIASRNNLPGKLQVRTASPQTFELQPELFFIPSRSSPGTGISVAAAIGAAARSRNSTLSVESVEAVVSVPVSQTGTLAPKVEKHELNLERDQDIGLYSIFKGNLSDDLAFNLQTTVDITATFSDGTVWQDSYNRFAVP
ncbi:heme peroxidase [Macrophomina phaseolina]|uniref:Peroxidase n=1 Tax=Macrophomina phaseolina TaxID=35725 RepID=A0ABQ8FRP0_9PEZI|nr:heme peroxidase [Macrophomina phaseolina]